MGHKQKSTLLDGIKFINDLIKTIKKTIDRMENDINWIEQRAPTGIRTLFCERIPSIMFDLGEANASLRISDDLIINLLAEPNVNQLFDLTDQQAILAELHNRYNVLRARFYDLHVFEESEL